jgi:hypothetical protein
MAKRGRPKIEFDLKQVEKLAMLQCTYDELAAFFDCSKDTIINRMKDDEIFSAAYKNGLEKGKMSLRRMQWRAAESGNVTMLIWLGKQHLDQVDKQDVKHSGEMDIEVKLVD